MRTIKVGAAQMGPIQRAVVSRKWWKFAGGVIS